LRTLHTRKYTGINPINATKSRRIYLRGFLFMNPTNKETPPYKIKRIVGLSKGIGERVFEEKTNLRAQNTKANKIKTLAVVIGIPDTVLPDFGIVIDRKKER